jgi:hypothetical protein
MADSYNLAADGVLVAPGAPAYAMGASGPPFDLEFTVVTGKQWPAVALQIRLDGAGVMQIATTAPRLKALAEWLAEQAD